MSFAFDPEIAATLEEMAAQNGPPPAPAPVGDVQTRRVALNAMLEWANNQAQPAMLSIDYRLAPDHPHPTPVEDAYPGLVWLSHTQPNLTSTPTASPSWATAPAEDSRPASPS
jgi:alpha/beta hydrolase fold